MDENDLFEMYGGARGIQKDPKVLKEWVLYSLISFGKDPNFPVGMPLPMPEGIKVTEKELKGSGWIILHENAPLPNWETGKIDGRTGQVVIKMDDV